MSDQWHFEFKDWQDAFYQKKAQDAAFCLVVSTWPETSGYWIERNATGGDDAKVYRSVKAVQALEARVTTARSGTNSVSLGGMIL